MLTFCGRKIHVPNLFTETESFHELYKLNDIFFQGANWMIRKMASKTTPSLVVSQDGDSFTLTLQSLVMTRTTTFKIGETSEEKQHSGDIMLVSTKTVNCMLPCVVLYVMLMYA